MPEEARRRYRIFEAAWGRFAVSDKRLTSRRAQRVCASYGIPVYQLRRIVRRQLAWDKYLRDLGSARAFRFSPSAVKEELCARLGGTRAVRFSPAREQILNDFLVWMTRIAKRGEPCGLGYSLPRALRMVGQLDLVRAPKRTAWLH